MNLKDNTMESTLNQDTVNTIQKAAFEKAVEIGYPKNKAEEYTFVPTKDFASYLEGALTAPIPVSLKPTNGIIALPLQEVLDGTHNIQKDSNSSVPWDREKLKSSWESHLSREADLHSATAQANASALFVYIPKGTSVSEPLSIPLSIPASAQVTSRQDFFIWIYADEESQTTWNPTIITENLEQHVNISYFVQLEKKSSIQWVSTLYREQASHSHVFDKVDVTLAEQATFQGVATTALPKQDGLARTSIEARLQGEGSHFEWNSSSVVAEKNQAHTYLNIHHEVPRATSKQFFKNVLSGFSRTSVDGTVHVHKDAQETEAEQLINNLMLSDDCKANNKPNLQIYADDVKCAHGATVGQLDASQLFYLQSRGFSLEQAKATLTLSYVQELIGKIQDPSLQSATADVVAKTMNQIVNA